MYYNVHSPSPSLKDNLERLFQDSARKDYLSKVHPFSHPRTSYLLQGFLPEVIPVHSIFPNVHLTRPSFSPSFAHDEGLLIF